MKNFILIIVALLVLFGGYVFWTSKGANNGKGEIVTLGVIAGTTGQYAAAGEGYLQGFNLALEAWNAESNSPAFKAVVEDDGFDAVKGLSAYQKLSSADKVDAYAIVSSFTIDAVYDLVHKAGKPVALGFEQSKPAEDDNILQVLPAARPIQFALGQEVKSLGYTKPVGAVSNTLAVFQTFFGGFNDGFGGNVPKFEMGSDIGAIRSQALAIVNAKPDVVGIFMAPADGAQLVKEILKISKDKAPYFVFDQDVQSGASDYAKILGSDISKLDGSLVSMSKNDLTPDFAAQFKAKYNAAPPFGADMGYNSFMLLAHSYNQDPQKWTANMKTAKFTGADGEVTFDKTGLRVPNVFFGKLKDGKVVN